MLQEPIPNKFSIKPLLATGLQRFTMSQLNKEYQEWKDQFKTQFYSIRQFVFRDSYGELLEQFNQLLIAMNLKVTEDNVETEVTEEESQ